MRFVNVAGRAGLLVDERVFDLEQLSGGRLPADPMAVLFRHWDEALDLHRRGAFDGGAPLADLRPGPPVPSPRSVFAIGHNYRAHAAETAMPLPPVPSVFTKFPSSIVGPHDDVVLPGGDTCPDWEAELVFVVAHPGRHIPAASALDHLAGYTLAQDISERRLQRAAGGQFSLGKSFDTFCPLGPAVVTLDELDDPLDLRLICRVNGHVRQDGRTTDMVTDVPHLVEFLSSVLTLRPGDICLTGTPAGVGVARQPRVFLQPGDVVETEGQGLGSMRNPCVAEPGAVLAIGNGP